MLGKRTEQKNMVSTLWFLLHLLHGLKWSDLWIQICEYSFFWFTACARNRPGTRRPGIDIFRIILFVVCCLFFDISVGQQRVCRMCLLHAHIVGHRWGGHGSVRTFGFDFVIAWLCQQVAFVRWGLECMHWTNVSTRWLGFMWYMRMGHKEQQRFIVDGMDIGAWFANIQPNET